MASLTLLLASLFLIEGVLDIALYTKIRALGGSTWVLRDGIVNAQVLARSGPVQSNWSIMATWDIEIKMDRVEYSKWVTSQLVPEFKIVRADESQLTFSKHTDGDTNSIECKLALNDAKLHTHGVFAVSPD